MNGSSYKREKREVVVRTALHHPPNAMELSTSGGRAVGGGGGTTTTHHSGGGGGPSPPPMRRKRLSRGLVEQLRAQTELDHPNAAIDGEDILMGDNDAGGSSAAVGGGDGDRVGGGGRSSLPPPDSSTSSSSSSSSTPIPAAIVLPRPNHSGIIALACVRNSLRMGVITKFYLTPQGKARKTLISKARSASRGGGGGDGMRHHRNRRRINNDIGGGGGIDIGNDHHRAEEIFLKNPPPYSSAGEMDGGGGGMMIGEEYYSSGDEDDLDASIECGSAGDSAAGGGGGGRGRGGVGGGHDKERHFVPTGPDASSTGIVGRGGIIANPSFGSGGGDGGGSSRLAFNFRKVRYFDAITASDAGCARRFLRGETDRARRARGGALSGHLRRARSRAGGRGGDPPATTTTADGVVEDDGATALLASDLRAGDEALSTALSRFPREMTPPLAAALLIESLSLNPHESLEGMAGCYDGIVSAGSALLDSANNNNGGGGKASEIMGALAPLLITTLEQSSGETLVALSALRNYCGTRRYRRRFVQRIAPCLVRPPNAAMWCLRHQGDMEPIVAAVEMILDCAPEVFGPGWYDRGRNMLKDTRRAENLRNAARSLGRLKTAVGSVIAFGGLSTKGAGGMRDASSLYGDSLAEWEVAALDRGARQSISDVFSKDWSRISALSPSPRESEISQFGSKQRRGISTAKSKEWDPTAAAAAANGMGSMPSSSLTKSPKLPLSPWGTHAAGSQLPSADALESTFGPSFSSQNVFIEDNERPTSPPLSPKRNSGSSKIATPKTPPHYQMDFDRISLPNLQGEQPPPTPQNSSPGRGSSSMLAPLSPQSSVGHASVSSMRSGVSTNQMSATREQYRALTSTATERKRTVAACRALRAQISQFEDAFVQMHGRAPKGAAERAPLASTYMQYREWKRAIRADAACRIQALCRGARARLMLTQGEDRLVANFVARRAAWSPASRPLIYLSIPLDMGADDSDVAMSRTRLETRTGQRGEDSVEVEMIPAPSTPASASPNWRNRQQRSPQQSPIGGTSPTTIASQGQRSSSSRSRSALPDISVMSLAELHQRKRELKQQLKLYDMNFHTQHGRMPEKREKEPIRHLYESYNAYKNQISVIERGEAQPGPGTAAFRGVADSPPAASDVAPASSASPTQNSENASSPGQAHLRRISSGGGSENSDANDSREVEADGPPSEVDMSSLRAEKATLHQTLRSYEKEFYRQHNRQVSSFADIRPVASQYRRYKEIKRAIAQQSSG